MNDLTKAQGTDVSTEVDLGLAGQLTHDDCERGRILVAQSNSTFLEENEDLRGGDIVEMASMEKLGGKGEFFDFIIVDMLKYWVVKDKDTKEFIERLPAINEKEYKWEEEVDGRLLSRVYHCSYLVLLPQDIEDGVEMPYELAFRSTGLQASKRINSIIMKKGAKQIPSYGFKFRMSTVKKEKNGNSWYVPVIEVGDNCSDKEKAVAKEARLQFSRVKEAIMNERDGVDTEKEVTSGAKY